MARTSMAKVARMAFRGLQNSRQTGVFSVARAKPAIALPKLAGFVSSSRGITTSPGRNGITPDDKPSKQYVETPEVVRTPAVITDAEYHAAADAFMERLMNHLEELEQTTEDMDVEYSSGVLNIRFGPEIGTYVVNKQPPNKQIWLSSPKSGPKRYDYVIFGDGQQDKQDTAVGEWLYLRDNSTMADLLREELGIDLRMSVGDY
ncbi:Frataxin-like domain-containing protein [Echria macrotheca]|uniref:ferroxidase n=1 Tax=Echria macrotheca TaxID=438768 RepID=A0AAJ0BCT6_9PEZI|nr:Frataxin-like domain-containing protein [Echria macrotheca]